MKLVLMGTPRFATFALQAIYDAGYDVTAVYTQPPKMQNRGHKTDISEIHKLANKLNLNIKTPKTLRSIESQNEFRDLNPDIAIISAYGMILPQEILDIPNYGCINIHPSSLPRWRGAAPIQRMMLAGDEETSVCIMKMDAGLDTGDILKQEYYKLSGNEDYIELHDRLANIGSDLLIDVIKNIENITPVKQDSENAIYAQKIDKLEYKIDWNNDLAQIERKIRALNPPGIYFEYNNERIKILKAEHVFTKHDYKFGQIIDDKFTIAANGGLLLPKMVQRPGKKIMSIEEMLRGFKIVI